MAVIREADRVWWERQQEMADYAAYKTAAETTRGTHAVARALAKALTARRPGR